MEKPFITWSPLLRMWVCQSGVRTPEIYAYLSGRGLSPVDAFRDWQMSVEKLMNSGPPQPSEAETRFQDALKYTQTRHRSIIDRLRGK